MGNPKRIANFAEVDVLPGERKRRRPGSDPQLREARQGVEQFLGDAAPEELVFLTVREIDERQDGDGLVDVVVGDGFGRIVADEALPDEDDDSDCEYTHDQAIEFAAGLRRNRLAAIDVLLSLEAFRRHLEGPGKQQREGQAQQDDDDESLQDPLRCTEVLEGKLRDLGEQPADHDVGNPYAYDIATLQFFEKRHCRLPGSRVSGK